MKLQLAFFQICSTLLTWGRLKGYKYCFEITCLLFAKIQKCDFGRLLATLCFLVASVDSVRSIILTREFNSKFISSNLTFHLKGMTSAPHCSHLDIYISQNQLHKSDFLWNVNGQIATECARARCVILGMICIQA